MTKGRRLWLCVVALAAGGVVACDDPISPGVRQPTFALPIEVFALTGGPINSPSAIRMATGSALRAEGLIFDVAFDIEDDDRVALYPVRLVASPAVGGHRVGIQTSTVPYAELLEAPRSGFRYDSLTVVSPGQTVILESSDPNMCSFSYVGTTFYAKLVVDSLNPVSRQIWSRLTVNPNCGSRSLAPGTPQD